MLPIPNLHLGVEIPRARSRSRINIHRRRHSSTGFADANVRVSRGRADGVAHRLAALGFVDERLPVQRPGKVGLRGWRFLLGLEVVEALLEEGARGR